MEEVETDYGKLAVSRVGNGPVKIAAILTGGENIEFVCASIEEATKIINDLTARLNPEGEKNEL